VRKKMKLSARISDRQMDYLKYLAEQNDTKISTILRLLLNYIISNDVDINVGYHELNNVESQGV
jgi:hypothetical protein